MKIVNKVLNDMDGNALPAGTDSRLTVALVLMNAALTAQSHQDPSKKPLSGNESVERFMFAVRMKKLAENEMFDLSAEEVVQYKEELPKLYPPLVSGQVIAIIEGNL